jgi:hypothetical protein
MKSDITVSVVVDNVEEKYRFIIDIPIALIQNTNFVEVINTLKITNPVGQLLALANLISEIKEGNEHG